MELILGVFLGIGLVFLANYVYNVVKDKKAKKKIKEEYRRKENRYREQLNSIFAYNETIALKKREVQ